MKDCSKIHPLLSLYQEGALSAREKAAVEKHVSGCPVARAELEKLDRLNKALRRLPEPKTPSDLHEKIMARLEDREPKKNLVWFKPAWTLTAAAAALALIVLTQYPRFTGGEKNAVLPSLSREQNLAFDKTAPAAPVKDNEMELKTKQAAPQPFTVNKPLILASKVRASKKRAAKMEDRKGFNLQSARADQASSNTKATFGAVAQPTMVVAMAPPAAQNYAPEPARSKVLKEAAPASAPAPPQSLEKAEEAPAPSLSAKLDQRSADNSISGAAASPALTSWNGSFSPVTVESQELVTDPGTFQGEWNKVQQGQPVPSVDFSSQTVVLLDAGNQPTTGYSIKLSRLEETADQLIVHYQVLAPAPGAVTGQMVTRPWAMQVIPKPSKPVTFQKD